MKRILLSVLLICFSFALKAQKPIDNYTPYNFWGNVQFKKGLYFPMRDTTFIPDSMGAITIRPQDTVVYIGIKTTAGGKHWDKLANWIGAIPGGSADSTLFATMYRLDTAKTNLRTSIGEKVPLTRTLTINGVTYDLSADRSWTVGGVTRVGPVDSSGASVSGAQIYGQTIWLNTFSGENYGVVPPESDSNKVLHGDGVWRTRSTSANRRDTLSGASPSWDFSTANFAVLPITASATVSVINSSDMDAGILRIIGNGTDSVILSGTSEDSLTILTGDGDITDVSFVNHGGSIYWQLVGRYTYAAPPAPATNWLTFTTATDLVETANEFTSPGGGTSFGNTGLDTAFFAAGQSGRIWHQYVDANSQACVLGFNTVNAQTGYAGMEAAVYFGTSDNLSKIDGGSAVTLGAVITYGHYVGVYRDGATGVIKLQFSSDEVTWTDQATLTYNTTAALYIVTDIQGNRQLSFPKFKRL